MLAPLNNFPSGKVSTHSRLKAAVNDLMDGKFSVGVSTHSRLKAAGNALFYIA